MHLIFNVLTLRALLDVLVIAAPKCATAPALLATHIAGIIAGSWAMRNFGPLAAQTGPSPRRRPGAALGASGGVSALLVAAACVAPRFPMNIMFIPISVPLAAVAGIYMLVDASFAGSATSTVAHAAHLGGGAVGVLAWRLLFRI